MTNLKKILDLVDPKLTKVFLPWIFRNPRYLITYKKLATTYINSVNLRSKFRKEGLIVPPFLILSITKQCNLSCNGCYAAAIGTLNNTIRYQLKKEEWQKIIKEAIELGVFAFIIAGGEPFLFPGLLDICKIFKNNLFIIFTNGTILNKRDLKALKKLTNVAVIVSIEGGREETDNRRGTGVYEKAYATIKKLNKKGIINGISVTITKINYKYWMEQDNIDTLINQGIKIGFFMEYIPTTPHEDISLLLTPDQRKQFRAKVLEMRENKRIYLIHSPGDEEFLGGCVSAGRGFAHIAPSGDLTPCPISNFATHNLTTASLKDALASPLFKKIRESEYLLETEGIPCALYAHQNEVQELVKSVGGYLLN